MRNRLSISRAGWSLSAILAVIYILVVVASLFLVGVGNTGSWQAAFLGIGWNTIAGVEFGLLGISLISFAIAGVFVVTYNFIMHRLIGKSKTHPPSSRPQRLTMGSWSTRLFVACLVLPAIILLLPHLLMSMVSASPAHGAAIRTPRNPDAQIQPVNMGRVINTSFREAEPSFTADGRTMYYNCNNLDICVSHLTGTWEEGNWTPPQVVGPPISTEYDEVEPWISASGDKLYFNSNRPEGRLRGIPFLSPLMNVFDVANRIVVSKSGVSFLGGMGMGHVWVSYRVNGSWSQPRPINEVAGEPPVNSAYHDHCLSFSADGNEAFWTSTRPGGFGGNDIWTSRKIDGKWTAPQNLGANVNGPGDEHHSILTPDGRSLFITSNRPGGYGGDDIYVTSRRSDGKWGPLVNLGSRINGPGDDRCAAWTPDFKIFLFDSMRDGGSGSLDLWWINLKNVYQEVPG